MDIQGAVNEIKPNPRRQIDEYEIANMQRNMELAGYEQRDPGAHKTIATFMLHRKHKQAERGLLLIGECGTGKTMWVEKFAKCKVMNASALVDLYKKSKETFYEVLEPPMYTILPDGYWDFTIDDMGEEPTLNDFGTKLEVIGEALSVRYRVFKRHGGKTYITTNLSKDGIKERYSSRIESRLCEMCTEIVFTCTDQRRSKF